MWRDRSRTPRTGGWPGSTLLLGLMLLAAPGRAAAEVAGPALEELIVNAARQGTLRVVVELKIDVPEPPSRERIVEAQERVLAELAGTRHRALRRFTRVPFIGLEVSEEALRRLGQSPYVIGIREDRLRAPQAPGSP